MTNTINNKIRVASSNIYTIEVNDQGDVIQLDLTDLNLFSNITKTFKKLETLGVHFSKKMQKIEDSYSSKEGEDSKLEKETKQLETLNNFYNQSRITLDIFLGEGACQKIFGNNNYITMFDDLAEALLPCIEDMKNHFEDYKKVLRKRYIAKKGRNQVRL